MASLFLPAPTRSGNKIGQHTSGGGGVNSTVAVSNIGGSALTNDANKINPTRGAATTTAPPSGSSKKRVPSYTDRCDAALRFSKLSPDQRKLPSNKKSMFVPRSTADFDDGGSFPEIHGKLVLLSCIIFGMLSYHIAHLLHFLSI